eukprot:24503-Prymnesium_polylepis.2
MLVPLRKYTRRVRTVTVSRRGTHDIWCTKNQPTLTRHRRTDGASAYSHDVFEPTWAGRGMRPTRPQRTSRHSELALVESQVVKCRWCAVQLKLVRCGPQSPGHTGGQSEALAHRTL